MLTRPLIQILHECNVKINTASSVHWKQIPSLKAWIYTTKNPEPISVTCKKGKTEKGHIMNSGLYRLSAGRIARTEHTTLIGTQRNFNSEELIYNPGFLFNILEISPIIHKNLHIPRIKSFLCESEKNEQLRNLHTEESLFTIEEKLFDLEYHHYKNKLAQKYWLGESSIFTLLVITTFIYFPQRFLRKNCKTCNNKDSYIKENQEEVELQPLSAGNQTNTEEIHPQRRVLTISTTNVRIA